MDGIECLPDLVISDYRLPLSFTAHDVVRFIGSQFSRPVPCLVITGEAGTNLQGALPALSADTLAARMVELAGRKPTID
ncbi:MAG: hypothetical protein CPDRYMAC_6192 [uncultured Paraburkholderia sp.]|nr:MAG: hypothetical protein CPDRYDRY_6099 [uncultured Paraburkholderia sp.]CAH2943837.1 MAG: hypothetical protein CPDRYMAC_6192 [uncultured Paraburkholderia sp.]